MPDMNHEHIWDNEILFRFNKDTEVWEKRVERKVSGLDTALLAVAQLQERIDSASKDLMSARAYFGTDEVLGQVIRIQGWKEITPEDIPRLRKNLLNELEWLSRRRSPLVGLIERVQEEIARDQERLDSMSEDDPEYADTKASLQASKRIMELNQGKHSFRRGNAEMLEQMIGSLVRYQQ